MKTIMEYEITDHGVEHAQHFQGAGTSFTKWDDCSTGCGNSPGEALADALEMLSQSDDWDVESLPDGWDEGLLTLTHSTVSPIIIDGCECETCPRDSDTGKPTCTCECECAESSELHHYVTIYVKAKLKCETDTPEMEHRIERAFNTKHGMVGDVNVDFEHGQWWVNHILTGACWSVVDASGGSSVDGFDFEQISEGEE